MSGIQWSQEQILLLLETLQAEPVIWNPNERGHKDRKKVNDAWVRIRGMLEIPIDELKKKKDSLFATYRSYCRKKDASIKSGAGVDEVYHPVWFAFDFMDSFMGSVFKCKPTISTDPETGSIEEENDASGAVEPISSPTPREENSIEPSQTRPTIRRRDNPPELHVASKQMSEAFNNLSKIMKNPAKDGDEDEWDIFGKLVAKKFKKIPEHERDDMMFNILALFRERERAERSPSIESFRSSTPYNSFIPTNGSIKRPKVATMVSPRPYTSLSEPHIAYVTSDQSNEGQHTYFEQPNEDTSSQRSSFVHTSIISNGIIPAIQTQSVSRRYKLSKSQNTAVYSNAMVSPKPQSLLTEPPNAYVTSDQSNEGQHTYIEQRNEGTSSQRSPLIHIISDDIIPATQAQSVSRRFKLSKSQKTVLYSNAKGSPRPQSLFTEPPNACDQSERQYILHIPETQTQSASPDDNSNKSDFIHQAFYDS